MRIQIIKTGGTIAKSYDESNGSLPVQRSAVEHIIGTLRLPDLQISYVDLFQKDSLDLTGDDRRRIVSAVQDAAVDGDGVIVIHGTDTLETTGEHIYRRIDRPAVPVVLTGAMRPHEFRDSDANQNVTEALLACRCLSPGVYVVMHNRILAFPGVVKDRTALHFTRAH